MNCNGGIRYNNNNHYIPMQPGRPSDQVVTFGMGAVNGDAPYRQPDLRCESCARDYSAPYPAAVPQAMYGAVNGIQCPGPETLPEFEPETLPEGMYATGYLRDNIGALMRVEFLIGGQTTARVGVLREVGANFIVLESTDFGSRMMCDLYSMKFATILQSSRDRSLMAGFVSP